MLILISSKANETMSANCGQCTTSLSTVLSHRSINEAHHLSYQILSTIDSTFSQHYPIWYIHTILLETSVDDDVVGSTMSGWARACRPDLLITLSISIIVSKSFEQSRIYKVFIKSHFLKTIVKPKCNEVVQVYLFICSLQSHDIGVLVNI